MWLLAPAAAQAAAPGPGAAALAGAALFGMLLFDEPADAARIGCIVLIVSGVLGLKLLHE